LRVEASCCRAMGSACNSLNPVASAGGLAEIGHGMGGGLQLRRCPIFVFQKKGEGEISGIPTGWHPRPAGSGPSGIHPSGIHPSGIHPSGIHPSGIHPSGIHPNGIHPSATVAMLHADLLAPAHAASAERHSPSHCSPQLPRPSAERHSPSRCSPQLPRPSAERHSPSRCSLQLPRPSAERHSPPHSRQLLVRSSEPITQFRPKRSIRGFGLISKLRSQSRICARPKCRSTGSRPRSRSLHLQIKLIRLTPTPCACRSIGSTAAT
jgi:hypothetical protein